MKDALASLAHAFKLVLEKLAQFFDILDLSFFVSGAIALGALLFWGELVAFTYPGWVGHGTVWLAAAIACYVLGVICFATGRAFRRLLGKTVDCSGEYALGIRAHGIEKALQLDEYAARGGLHALYAKGWAELRETETVRESFELVRRYWTLAAFCDGAAAALALWLIVIAYGGLSYKVVPAVPVPQPAPQATPAPRDLAATVAGAPSTPAAPGAAPTRAIPVVTVLVLGVVLIVAIRTCLEEARRYQQYQAEELAATIAYHLPLRERNGVQDDLEKQKKELEIARKKTELETLELQKEKLEFAMRKLTAEVKSTSALKSSS